MKTTALFGPPGTGKTRTLVERIAKDLRSTTDMAVVSFSRVAAKELADRSSAGTKPYFTGTIHSFCYGQLGLDKGQVISDSMFCNDVMQAYDPADVQQALDICRFARCRKMKLVDAYREWSGLSVSFSYLEIIQDTYNNWKSHFGLVDFDDMLIQAVGKTSKFSVVYVDEAQDLSLLQWDVVRSMVRPDGRLIVAGDDDQAIFEWAGAYPHGMKMYADDKEVLSQSYRIPKAVYEAATRTVHKIKDRQDKKYRSTADKGYVVNAGMYVPGSVPHTVMCRDRYVIKEMEAELIEAGLPYKIEGVGGPGLFLGRTAQIVRACRTKDLEKLRKLKRYLSPYGNESVNRGIVPHEVPAIGNFSDEVYSYLCRTDIDTEPKITLSTIHAQKGKEFDHGVLIAHCSPKVESLQERTADRDGEIRVWYVALSRVKKGVTIVGSNPYLQI